LLAVPPRSRPQELKISDAADVLQPVVLEQRESGGVVTAVLQALEAAEQKLLASPLPHVADDPAHTRLLLPIIVGNAIECEAVALAKLVLFPARNSLKRRRARLKRPLPASETVSRALVRRAPRS